MTMDWQTLQVPLAAGLNQKLDDRARQPPFLDIATDVQFDELGGLQTRYPFATLGDTFASSDVRRVYSNGEELVVFTQEGLYTRNSQTGAWLSRGTHMAVKTTETPRFVTTADQLECDRAELNNIIVYAWTNGTGGGVLAAAIDKSTGAVICPPTEVSDAVSRPRLVALSTKILLFFVDSASGLSVSAIDTSDVATSVAGNTSILAAPDFNTYYDAVKIPSADSAIVVARRTPTTSYEIIKVTAAVAVTQSTKARTCDGPIAVACSPDGANAQVIRGNGTAVQGDRITISSLADAATGQAIGTATGTPINQITCAYRSTQDSGQYRCYAFWSAQQAVDATNWICEYNYVDTGGTIGAEATLKRRLGVASRAFEYNGHVYVWGGFALESGFSGAGPLTFRAQLQNTYFLYRDDGFLTAKAAAGRAGGYSSAIGYLPGVALVSGSTGFAWCGIEKRIIELGGVSHSGYGARAPRDIVFTFDSNEARRVARLGSTLYITGGEILQYDGEKIVECGFHLYPWYFGIIENADVGAAMADGTYAYKLGWRWENATGEIERSTTATTGTVVMTGGVPSGASIVATIPPLPHTHKTADISAPAVEVWRTAVNPTEDSPFYLVSSKDPAAGTNPNRYLSNDETANSVSQFDDYLADSTATTKEIHPENGGILENLSPPPATIITANDTRLFLAGVAGDPHRVWYSKLRGEGEIAAFHDALTVDIPPAGGDITALAFLNETLIVFRETAIYAVAGDGFDNAGQGQNYGPARMLASDVGAVSHEAVALTSEGLVFKSNKGWYLLNRGWATNYIGAPIVNYDSETVVAVHALESKHQVRCLTSSRMLVLDTLANQWAEWTIASGLHAAIHQGTYVYALAGSIKSEQTSYTSLTYGMDVETAWIKVADLQGAGRVRALQVLGEYRSAHDLRIRIAYNYDSTYIDDKYWDVSPTTVGGPLQVRLGPTRQNVQAIKVRLTAVDASDHGSSPTGEALKLTGLGFEVGLKRGLWRRLPSAQRQ